MFQSLSYIQKCCIELLEDGEPHNIGELSDYTRQKAEEQELQGNFKNNYVWLALKRLTTKRDSDYTNIKHGYYQKGGTAVILKNETAPKMAAEPDCWSAALDTAVELENTLALCFSKDMYPTGMTEGEAQNYELVSKSAQQAVQTIIEGIAVCLAQQDDHANRISMEQAGSMDHPLL